MEGYSRACANRIPPNTKNLVKDKPLESESLTDFKSCLTISAPPPLECAIVILNVLMAKCKELGRSQSSTKWSKSEL